MTFLLGPYHGSKGIAQCVAPRSACLHLLQVIAAMTVGKDVSPLFPGGCWHCSPVCSLPACCDAVRVHQLPLASHLPSQQGLWVRSMLHRTHATLPDICPPTRLPARRSQCHLQT